MASRNAGDGGKSGMSAGTLVPIIVALITVSGVFATALFSNWDKIFGRADAVAAPPQTGAANGASATPGLGAVPAQKDAAQQLSDSQQRAYGAATGALDDVARQIAGGAPVPQASTPAAQPSIAGIWRDTDGYSFDVRQQGNNITHQQYLNGALVGTGGGEIHGLELRYTYLATDDRGQCVAHLVPAGNQISGTCRSIAGQRWQFAITR